MSIQDLKEYTKVIKQPKVTTKRKIKQPQVTSEKNSTLFFNIVGIFLILCTLLSLILAIFVAVKKHFDHEVNNLSSIDSSTMDLPSAPATNNHLKNLADLAELLQNQGINSSDFGGFDQVFGLETTVTRLKEVAHIFNPKNTKFYEKIINPEPGKLPQLTYPKGVLLYGPPGTGKTFLAKAFAKDSEMNFYEVTPANTLEQIQQIFKKARKNSPSLIFADEAEEILKSRSSNFLEPGDAKKTDLFLAEIDGVKTDPDNPVYFIAATNHVDKIDSAILSRLDKMKIDYFKPEERLDYLKLMMTKKHKLNIEENAKNYYLPFLMECFNYALENPELFAVALNHGLDIPALGKKEIKGIVTEGYPNGKLATIEDNLAMRKFEYDYARSQSQKLYNQVADLEKKTVLVDKEKFAFFYNNLPELKAKLVSIDHNDYQLEDLEKIKKHFYDLQSGRKLEMFIENAARKAGFELSKSNSNKNATVGKIEISALAAAFKDNFGFQPDYANTNAYTKKIIESFYNLSKITDEEVKKDTRPSDSRFKRFCHDFTIADLKNAGLTVSTIKQNNFGYSNKQLISADYPAKDLKNIGFTVADLKNSYSVADLKNAGYSLQELKDASYSTQDLKNAGYSLQDLKNAGYSLQDLKDASYSLQDLKDASYSTQDLKNAGYSLQDLKDASYSTQDLKNAGYSAQEFKDANYSPQALKSVNYSASVLKNVGYSTLELKDAGYSLQELKDAGYSLQELKDASYSTQDLKNAGYSAQILKNANYAISDLRAAGYSAKTLKAAGYSASDLKSASYPLPDLMNSGYSTSNLRTAGYSAKTLKAAGYSASDLKSASYPLPDLINSGYSIPDLKAAGYLVSELMNVGSNIFHFCDLKAAGYSTSDLKAAGYSTSDLKAAGYSDQAIKNAGYPALELTNAGII